MSFLISTSGIAAHAFVLLKQRPISSFAETDAIAIQAAAAYDDALGECLEYGDWSFASQIVDLNAVDPAATPGFVADTDLAYGFQLPADFVRVRKVEPSHAEWRVDMGFLRSDQPGPLRIRYTARITAEDRLPSSFRLCVAYRMAALLPNLLRDDTDMNRLLREGQTQLKSALSADRAQQSPQRHEPDDRMDDWATEALL